ncbi:MAG: nucleoside phosphorylase [Thermoplasmata archaeon]|nr:nucleoside phosphorylase [Thermoplasmata archaeon]
MAKKLRSSETMETEEGKQYHIGLRKGEVAENILLCGDPARAGKVAKEFEKIRVKATNREYVTYTGIWNGIEVTVMSTGIGCDNTEIAVVELLNIVENPILIRIGSCGALQPFINLGDLVISTAAVRLENTSLYFVPDGYPAVAHYKVVQALEESARKLGYRYHVGLTATAPGFYGAQGRAVNWPLRKPDMVESLANLNVYNMEMEASTLFTLASIKGLMAGAVCAVYAQRKAKQGIPADLKERAERACYLTGLNALAVLRN